ncbi:titin-like isoform X1, partial [Dinothrombium tinctorium]
MYVSNRSPLRMQNASPPMFEKLPSNTQFVEGGDVLFQCKVTGNPSPEVVWTRRGMVIRNDLRRTVSYDPQSGICSLAIKKLTIDDDGEYTCTAVNAVGEASLTVNIHRQQQQPQQQTQDYRQSSFVCTKYETGQQTMHRTISSEFGEYFDPNTPVFYSGRDETFRIDTFEYRLLREEEFRQTVIRQYTSKYEVWEQERPAIPNQPLSAPQVLQKPRNSKLVEGSEATFQARLTSNPPPKTYWFHNGRKINSSQRHRISFENGIASLYINNVQPEDAGYYTLLAENNYGQAVCSAHLVIEASEARTSLKRKEFLETDTFETDETVNKALKPHFYKIPPSQEVAEGKMVRFDCRVGGRPQPDVLWYLNGRQLVDDTTHKLIINEGGVHSLMITFTTLEDAGTITCVARNRNGECRFDVNLTVIEREQVVAPKFIERFKTVNVREGESVSLHCRAVGTPVPRMIWQKDGVQIHSRPPNLIIETNEGSSTLYLNHLTAYESGWYQCTAQNQAGSTATRARVFVIVEPQKYSEPWSLHLPKPQKVIEPEPVSEPETIYLRHIERAPPRKPHPDDSPQFTEKPTFVTHIKDIKVNEGDRAIFEAKLLPIGDPSLKVEWYLNGILIEASSRIMTEFRFGYVALHILYVYQSDFGTYICRAINDNGEAVSQATLTVFPKGVIDTESQHPESIEAIRHLEDYEHYKRQEDIDESVKTKPKFKGPLRGPEKLNEGQSVHFETRLEPENDSTMTVEWYHNGRPLMPGHRFKTYFDFGYVALDILYVYPEDTGTYTVVARNALGQDVLSKEIYVEAMRTVDTRTMHDQSMRKIQQLEGVKFHKEDEYEEEYDKPVFVSPLRGPKQLTEGQIAHFECRVKPTGDDNLKIFWYQNGIEVKQGSRFNFIHDFGYVCLDIASVIEEDSGVYTVKAVNLKGEAISSTTLDVRSVKRVVTDLGIPEQRQYIEKTRELEEYRKQQHQAFLDQDQEVHEPPVFKTQLKDQLNIHEGKTAHFEATLIPQGDSKLKVEWFHNGKQIEASSRVNTFYNFGYVSLTIKEVDTRDVGTYTCVATNSLGTAQTSANLTCITKESIILETQFEEGWEKIQSLEGAAKFVRPEIQDAEVNQKPTFTSQLIGPERLNEGQSAHFETRIQPENDATMTIEWFFNGKPLPTGHRYRTYHDFGYVAIDILYVYPEDTGTFTVVAKNKLGQEVLSKHLQVIAKSKIDTSTLHEQSMQRIKQLENVKYVKPEEPEITFDKPQFVSPLKGTTRIREGQGAHFECRINPVGDDNLKIFWYHNGIEMKQGSRFNFIQDFGYVCLDIAGSVPEDAGVYTCRVVNLKGEAVSSITLEVESVTQIVTDLGIPEQKQYIEKTQELEEYRKRSQYQFLDLEPKITEKPMFKTPISDQLNIHEGRTAHFEATLTPQGDPKMKVEWFHNGKQIEASSRVNTFYNFGYVSLTIKEVDSRDVGTYTCVATNELGTAQTSANLTCITKESIIVDTQFEEGWEKIQSLEGAPKFKREEFHEVEINEKPRFTTPLYGSDRLNEGQSAHFETRLEPKNDSTMKVEWFLNGKPLPTGHRFRTYHDFGYVALDILYVYPEDIGTFTVVAKNKLGQDTLSKQLEVIARSKVDTSTLHDQSMQRIQQLEEVKFVRTEEPEVSFEAPVFISPLQGTQVVTEGQSAHFECRVTPVGDNNLKIFWYLNGIEMKQGSRFNFIDDFGYVCLDIAGTVPEDSGLYTCRAVNLKGEATTSIQLEVKGIGQIVTDLGIPEQKQYIEKTKELEEYKKRSQYQFLDLEPKINEKPTFKTPIADQLNVPEGRTAHFEATLTPQGDPKMQVEWYLNGKQIEASSRINTFFNFGYVSLTIKEVDARDVGTISCVAKNELGTAQTSAKLTCITRESIIVDTQFEEGWEKIQTLEGTAKFQKAEFHDIVINEKPKFTAPLSGPDLLNEGQSAHFETRLEPKNDPAMTVEWFLNGRPLPVGHRFRTYHDFGYVALDILYVYPEESGTYMVRARNKLGEDVLNKSITIQARSRVDTRTLHDQSLHHIQQLEGMKNYRPPQEPEKSFDKPKFTTPLTGPQELTEGGFIHYECRVTPAEDPDLRLVWFKNERELIASSRVNFTYDFGYVCLDIAAAVPSDSGVYKCVAMNKKGEDVVTTTLKIKSKLLDVKQLVDKLFLGVGTIITDLGIPEQKHYIEKTEELEEYQRRQMQQSFVDLEVLPKQAPVFTTQLLDQIDIIEGRTVHFEATLEPQGDQTMKVEWFKDEQLLEASSRITTFFNFGYVALTIKDVDSRDIGTYTCVATNRLGSAKTSARLTCIARKSIIVESQLASGVEKLKYLEESKVKVDYEEYQIKQKPKFTRPLSTHEKVSEGQNAHFETRLEPTGDPTMVVEWYFNGKPLRTGHRFRTYYDFGYVALDILYTYPEDSGEYAVRAVNELGEDCVKATLVCRGKPSLIYHTQLPKEMESGVMKIAELEASWNRYEQQEEAPLEATPPSFVMKPEPQTVNEGEPAKFCCRVVGYPRPRIFWVLNGNTVISGSRYKLTYDGIYYLDIPRTRQYDQGKVEVFARNIKGEAYAWTTLDVKPRHDDYRVVLKHSPRPWYDSSVGKYQRERQETELQKVFEEKLTPGGTEVQVWKTEQTDDERVKVTEVKKYKTDVVYVDKRAGEKLPDDQSQVQWMARTYQSKVGDGQQAESVVQGKEVHVQVQKQIQKQQKGDLEITRDVKTTETRSKEHKNITKERKIMGPGSPSETVAPAFTKKIQPCRVYEGERALFECVFTGTPPPTITWYRENFAIQNSRDFQIETTETTSSLVIREVYLEDSGIFSVKAENRGGSAKSSANLIVEEARDIREGAIPPSFAKTLQDTSVKAGQLVRLDVRVTGSKPLDIYWLKEGIRVTPDITHKMIEEDGQNTLLILEATMEDSGSYECIAINQVGEARCQANVHIQGIPTTPTTTIDKSKPPQLIEPLRETVVREGQSALLKCKIAGATGSQVTWFKGDSPIKQSRYFRMGNDRDLLTLRISESFPEDEGIYKCCVSNPSGKVTTSASLRVLLPETVEKPPVLSPLADLTVPEGTPARFVTSLSGSPPPTVSWFRNNKILKTSKSLQMLQDNASCSLVIYKTRKEDEGLYTCRANNPSGHAETSARLTVETQAATTAATVDDTRGIEYTLVDTGESPKPGAPVLSRVKERPKSQFQAETHIKQIHKARRMSQEDEQISSYQPFISSPKSDSFPSSLEQFSTSHIKTAQISTAHIIRKDEEIIQKSQRPTTSMMSREDIKIKEETTFQKTLVEEVDGKIVTKFRSISSDRRTIEKPLLESFEEGIQKVGIKGKPDRQTAIKTSRVIQRASSVQRFYPQPTEKTEKEKTEMTIPEVFKPITKPETMAQVVTTEELPILIPSPLIFTRPDTRHEASIVRGKTYYATRSITPEYQEAKDKVIHFVDEAMKREKQQIETMKSFKEITELKQKQEKERKEIRKFKYPSPVRREQISIDTRGEKQVKDTFEETKIMKPEESRVITTESIKKGEEVILDVTVSQRYYTDLELQSKVRPTQITEIIETSAAPEITETLPGKKAPKEEAVEYLTKTISKAMKKPEKSIKLVTTEEISVLMPSPVTYVKPETPREVSTVFITTPHQALQWIQPGFEHQKISERIRFDSKSRKEE